MQRALRSCQWKDYGGGVSRQRPSRSSYHHGDLRRVVLAETVTAIEQGGPSAISLRAIARNAGVAHTSVTHHFGDKAGLLAAVAAEGYTLLGDELRAVHDGGGSFLDLGVAYVRFATAHRAHFEVMFRPDLYRADDPDVAEARSVTGALLHGQAGEITGRDDDRLVAAVAGWSLVHGLAGLWLGGNLPPQLGDDPEEITRVVAAMLGRGQRRRGGRARSRTG